MSRSRNYLIARSIAFGLVTKLTGSLVVLVGLPVIAHQLTSSDYTLFLKTMSASSFLTLFLGAAVSVTVRQLAVAISENSASEIAKAEAESMGLFILSMAASTAITLIVVALSRPDRPFVIILAVLLSAFAGLFLWADSYRLALRSDFVSSIWQTLGALGMLLALVLLSSHGVLAVVLAYFGTPVIAQVAIFMHLQRQRKVRFRPSLSIGNSIIQARRMAPILINSVAEYVKIFVSGLLLSIFVTGPDYSRYATLLLIIARFVNPLSLITRPMMPAYIDAIASGDIQWLKRAGQIITALATLSLAAVPLCAYELRPEWLNWLMPKGLPPLTGRDLLFAGLFFWGHAIASFILPLYIASERTTLFAVVNSVFVAVGVCLGILAVITKQSDMLSIMAVAIALSGVVLTWVAVRRLLIEDREASLA